MDLQIELRNLHTEWMVINETSTLCVFKLCDFSVETTRASNRVAFCFIFFITY